MAVTSNIKQRIFFVDDEPEVLKMVGRTLEQAGYNVSCFSRAADCIKQLRYQTCALLITDVKMPEMDGIELLSEAKRIIPLLPVLVITGYGDIPMAVRALKLGASDFVEKPLDREGFLSTVELILRRIVPADSLLNKTLTKTEIKILRLILGGKSNKEIARLRHRSIRTVESQRSHIMRKLGADNLVDLLKRTAAMGLFELPANGSAISRRHR
jgi:two-component system response regulator FixJ